MNINFKMMMWRNSGQNELLPPGEAALVGLRAVSHRYFTGVRCGYVHDPQLSAVCVFR